MEPLNLLNHNVKVGGLRGGGGGEGAGRGGTLAPPTHTRRRRTRASAQAALAWSLFENVSASLRSGDVMSAYLYLLTGSNSVVGLVQGLSGVLQLVVALPAGWAADRYRRDAMLRVGSCVGACAGVLLGGALATTPRVWALAAAMGVLGCYRGVYSAALEALWADSIAPGRR